MSQLELRLNGDRPLLLSANPGEDNALLTVDLANPDMVDADGAALHRELIYINRRQFVWQGAYNELLLVHNFDLAPHAVTVGLRFAADFVDVFEVRGQERPRAREVSAERLSSDTVLAALLRAGWGRALHDACASSRRQLASIPGVPSSS